MILTQPTYIDIDKELKRALIEKLRSLFSPSASSAISTSTASGKFTNLESRTLQYRWGQLVLERQVNLVNSNDNNNNNVYQLSLIIMIIASRKKEKEKIC